MTFSSKTARKLQVALTVGAVASTLGTTIGAASRAVAGPTLSSLINLTNSANVTVNNVSGQSFSVNGILSAAILPFTKATSVAVFNTGMVMFSAIAGGTLGLNPLLGKSAGTLSGVGGEIEKPSGTAFINLGKLSGITLKAASGIQTVGASIQNTAFGVSGLAVTSSFSNQTTTSLTAF